MSGNELTRRQFLKGSAAVATGVAAGGVARRFPLANHPAGASPALNVYTFPSNTAPQSAIQKVFNGFTSSTGIKVNQIPEPSDYATFVQKITTDLSAGFTGYDVIYTDDFTLQTFAAAGWLLPLNSMVPKSSIDALSKTHVDLSSYRGKVYRIPINQSFYIQFYRKDLLAKAGLSVPQTWAQLLSAGRTLTKGGNFGISLAGSPPDAFDDMLYYMPQAGGSFLDLDSPATQNALEFMHELVSVYKVVPPTYVSDSYDNIPTYFENGYVAVWATWNGFMGGFVADTKFFKGGKTVGVARPAKGPVSDVTDVGDWGWSISKYSPQPDNAAKFVAYASSKAAEVTFAETQSVPARQDAVNASRDILFAGSQFATILDEISEVPRPVTPYTTLIQNNVTPILVDYVAGKTSLKTAVRSGQTLIKKYSGS
jgi:multiple sugar transport system substrate-binding protein